MRARVVGLRAELGLKSGSLPSAVRQTIAPERLAMSEGSPQAEKMEEKESPMTMVYCRLTESVRMPMSAEGTQAVDSPTDLDHASPHDLEPVAAHTRPTAEKPDASRRRRR